MTIKEECIGWPELELLPKNEENEWIWIPWMTVCSSVDDKFRKNVGWAQSKLVSSFFLTRDGEWIWIPWMTLSSGGWQVKEEWGMSSTRVGFFLLPKQDEDEEDDEEFVITPRHSILYRREAPLWTWLSFTSLSPNLTQSQSHCLTSCGLPYKIQINVWSLSFTHSKSTLRLAKEYCFSQ